jgi:FkbM family methyltransferase
VHLSLGTTEDIDFRWSYIVPFHDTARHFFDYWGHDTGELRFLWRVLQPGMTFLDIGAYHGVYSMVAARRVESEGCVIAFEPSPRERHRIKMHLRWNNIRSARLESCAIGSGPAESVFFQVVDGDTSRNGLRAPASSDVVSKVAVKIVGLDQYIREAALSRVDVVKMDVEGGELGVFQSAGNLLTKLRPIFICEVLDAATQPWNYDARNIVDKLREYEFEWFEFCPDGNVVPHETQERYPEVRNYLAVPREKCTPAPDWMRRNTPAEVPSHND